MAKKTFIRKFEDDFVITAKRRIRDIVLYDKDIQNLLTDNKGNSLIPTDSMYKSYEGIFPYIFVPTGLVQDVCYICYKLDQFKPVTDNPLVTTYRVTFVVFCSVKLQETGMMANRVDCIGYCLKDLFGGSAPLGLTWETDSDFESILTSGYVCRTLEFVSTGINRTKKVKHEDTRDELGYLRKAYANAGRELNEAIYPDTHGLDIYDDSGL